MEKLWAPWRINYIKAKKPKACIFCKALKSPDKNFVILKSRHAFSLLNIFPYNNGHAMVSPKRHIRELSRLTDLEIVDLIKTLNRTKKLLERVLKPDGYNIGINIDKCAGAGITGHLHIHIVPRWQGDTNFMPVLYATKIISQSLNDLYKRLKNAQSKKD